MTQPHLMNCPHNEEGWCLSCLKVEWERWDELTKPAEIVHSLEPVPCAKCEGLRARLPHTADGVPVICDGMVIVCPKGHEHALTHATGRLYCCKGECWSDGCQGDSGSGTYYAFSQCLTPKENTRDA